MCIGILSIEKPILMPVSRLLCISLYQLSHIPFSVAEESGGPLSAVAVAARVTGNSCFTMVPESGRARMRLLLHLLGINVTTPYTPAILCEYV